MVIGLLAVLAAPQSESPPPKKKQGLPLHSAKNTVQNAFSTSPPAPNSQLTSESLSGLNKTVL